VGNLWLKIKVWTKVLIFFALLLYAILFIYQNSTREVKPWFWFGHGETTTSVLILGLCAFLAGVIGTIVTRTTFKTVRQIRQLKDRTRSDRLQREVEEMKMKAAKLRSRPAAGGTTVASTEIEPESFDQPSNQGELP
jgi:hypothetical protein